ncbi:lipopolysaccharide assembly protein LapA domain-containing protein [Pseudoalteromonas xiamenensis]|uniref:lipopolysaccharide assembly protein LapA domain-containing protein n=1 Tax=Pseudoalteromonas xiamenensis TaxID=882626 RepID=UPI001FCB2A15|nr:LapA family protein [Pseudoalteromonas xiamenensis]
MLRIIIKGVAISLIILAFILGTQNPHLVKLNFIVASSTLPLAAVMSICFILGIAVGLAVFSVFFTKLKWQHYRYKKQNSAISDVEN